MKNKYVFSWILQNYYNPAAPLYSWVAVLNQWKIKIFRIFDSLKTIGFALYSTRSSQILQNPWFFSLVVKGILLYKNVLYFFSTLFILWSTELNWLIRTWNFMDFSSWGAILQARGVFFIFWIHRNCPGLRPRKSMRNTKNQLFSIFWILFILLRVSSRLTDFLKVCKMWFSGPACLNFGKSMIPDTSANRQREGAGC